MQSGHRCRLHVSDRQLGENGAVIQEAGADASEADFSGSGSNSLLTGVSETYPIDCKLPKRQIHGAGYPLRISSDILPEPIPPGSPIPGNRAKLDRNFNFNG